MMSRGFVHLLPLVFVLGIAAVALMTIAAVKKPTNFQPRAQSECTYGACIVPLPMKAVDCTGTGQAWSNDTACTIPSAATSEDCSSKGGTWSSLPLPHLMTFSGFSTTLNGQVDLEKVNMVGQIADNTPDNPANKGRCVTFYVGVQQAQTDADGNVMVKIQPQVDWPSMVLTVSAIGLRSNHKVSKDLNYVATCSAQAALPKCTNPIVPATQPGGTIPPISEDGGGPKGPPVAPAPPALPAGNGKVQTPAELEAMRAANAAMQAQIAAAKAAEAAVRGKVRAEQAQIDRLEQKLKKIPLIGGPAASALDAVNNLGMATGNAIKPLQVVGGALWTTATDPVHAWPNAVGQVVGAVTHPGDALQKAGDNIGSYLSGLIAPFSGKTLAPSVGPPQGETQGTAGGGSSQVGGAVGAGPGLEVNGSVSVEKVGYPTDQMPAGAWGGVSGQVNGEVGASGDFGTRARGVVQSAVDEVGGVLSGIGNFFGF